MTTPPPTFAQEFGERLRQQREAAGLTQKELANAARITRATVSLLEVGRSSPTAHTLLQLCEALHVSADKLLGRAPC